MGQGLLGDKSLNVPLQQSRYRVDAGEVRRRGGLRTALTIAMGTTPALQALVEKLSGPQVSRSEEYVSYLGGSLFTLSEKGVKVCAH